ncbi:MAG: single-stranded-DNA-specific exonuclease RecJ, partial [Chitinophagales bacterium]
TQRPGLHALMSSVGLMDRELGTWHIGYIIAPRINAAGRIGDANLAVRLLLTKDQTEASALAENLNDYNRMRQEIESEILKEASREAEGCIERQESVLVVAGESWHQGVIGIVASRLVDAYHRPTILISWEGEMGRGSGRSLKGFNLHQALFQCQDYLQRFGGHPLAAGISLNRDQFQDFRTAFNEVAATTEYHEGHSEINIDCEIDYDQITRELVQELARLEPYGEGNPEPRLLIRRTQILNPGAVGKNREHLKFWVGSQGQKIDAIAFRMTVPENWSYETQLYDLIFQPDINSYRGKESIQIKIHDLKPSDQFDFPINLSSGTEEEPVISRAEAAMKHGLNSGHPVVVVYPTLRSLEKHLTGLRGVFPAGLLIPLHGGMYRLIRKRSMESLINGNCQIFLTTYPFFRYYISKVGLRNNPKFIMLWPGDGIDLSGDTWQVFTLDTGVRIVGQEGNLDKYNEPTIIYANRRKTLHFSDSSDRVSNEAGETSLSRRLQARLRFLTGEADCLAWDGVIGGGLPTVNASRFVLADAPFGYYEIQNCLAQFSEPVKEIESSFTRESILFNRAFLSAQYPDRAVLENYYNRLAGAGRQKITREQIRNGAFSTEPGCAWPEVEFRAVLNVLADCNLCDYSYRETIYDVEIKKGSFSPVDSAFYIEGLEEKKVLVDFVKALGDTGMRLS